MNRGSSESKADQGVRLVTEEGLVSKGVEILTEHHLTHAGSKATESNEVKKP